MTAGRVVHITSVHQPRDVRILYKECFSLAQADYEVALIAPADSEERIGAVRVHAIRRPKGRLDRLTRTQLEVLRLSVRLRADLYHLHDPELIPVGIVLKMLGCRVIYDAHENLPRQVLGKPWIPSALRGPTAVAASAIEQVARWAFDGLVVANRSTMQRLRTARTVLVQNFALRSEMEETTPDRRSAAESVIAYVGSISPERGLWEMVEAVRLVSQRHPDVRLVLAGPLAPGLEQRGLKTPGWERVTALGWQSRDEIRALLGGATVGLSLLHPLPNSIGNYPTKLFEYMAAGIPVVISNFPLWRQVIEPPRCGISVDPMDVGGMAGAISWLLSHPVEAAAMGARGREEVLERFTWDAEAATLIGLYERVLA